jgi:hypothetical protein
MSKERKQPEKRYSRSDIEWSYHSEEVSHPIESWYRSIKPLPGYIRKTLHLREDTSDPPPEFLHAGLPKSYYQGTYECNRCNQVWLTGGTAPPLDFAECITPGCSNPSVPVYLLRALKREIIRGEGKLKKVDAWRWKYKTS